MTRPVINQSAPTSENELRALQESKQNTDKLKLLDLVRANSGNELSENETCEILLTQNKIVLDSKQGKREFPGFDAFRSGTSDKNWPATILLYVDRLIAFQDLIRVIDHIKQRQNDISIRLAVLSKE